MAKRINVVLSQGQSNHPAKRHLEEELVTALMLEPGIDVTVVPNLYDLKPDGTGILALQGITGNLVVLSWLYSRAAFWTLDRHGILGQEGRTLLKSSDEDDDDDDDSQQEPDESPADDKPRVRDSREVPRRKIYCLDLRSHDDVRVYVDEIKRIAAENATQVVGLMDWIGGQTQPPQLGRYLQPTNDTALGGGSGNGHGGIGGHDASGGHGAASGNGSAPGNGAASGNGAAAGKAALTGNVQGPRANLSPADAPPAESPDTEPAGTGPRVIDEQPDRRWYPVIDFSRCTNCMECIDFCLFGVYGVDAAETILVEQPDNCRKGCPACSRVCPENAIIFPQHKTPVIAGAPGEAGGLKIDLSQLFGKPDAVEVAAAERDEQLLLAGRDAVGLSVGIPKRQQDKPDQPKDALDNLLDSLDELDL